MNKIDAIKTIIDSLTKSERQNLMKILNEKPVKRSELIDFCSWLSEQNFTNPDININDWVDEYLKSINSSEVCSCGKHSYWQVSGLCPVCKKQIL